MYWIENSKDGSFVAGAKTYKEALAIQNKKLKESGIDTYIRTEKMTKKELQSIVALLSSIRRASAEIKSYCEDYDSKTLKSAAKDLDEAVKNFRKETKI